MALNMKLATFDAKEYEQGDAISLHRPGTIENYHMIDTTTINKMKKNVTIINTFRITLIDSQTLLDGIKSRHIGCVY